MLCAKRKLEVADSSFGKLESLIPPLLTPGAAEALAVKIYRQARTTSSRFEEVLRECLADYQNPVPADILDFQITLAAKEESDLDYVQAPFRSDLETR